LFDTINELLDNGVTSCTTHEAHTKIDDLFHEFQQILAEVIEVEAVELERK
jgi:hypothetical protein